MNAGTRAQTETVGTVLVLGLVVLGVSVAGAVALDATVGAGGDDAPLVELRSSVEGSNLTITHRTGDAVRAGSLAVVTRSAGETTRYEFDTDGTIGGNPASADDSFEEGDRWRPTGPVGFTESDAYVVLVVHEPSNTVLYRAERTADAVTETPRPDPTPRPTTAVPPSTPTGTATPTSTPTSTPTPTATPSNQPPNASFDRSPATVAVGGSVSFTDQSTDADGTVVSRQWDFGDGNTSTAVDPTHSYAAPGAYDVTLTVTDDDGATATATTQVQVTASPATAAIRGVRVDDRSENTNTVYDVYYDVENLDPAGTVVVGVDDTEKSWPDETTTLTDGHGVVEYQSGGTEGDTFEISVRAYDENGSLVDEVVLTDVSGGGNTLVNGSLARSDSPFFAGVVVDDIGGPEATYEVSYDVTNRSSFGSVRVVYDNLDSGGADATYTSTDPRNNVDDQAEASFGGTAGDEYRIRVQLLDDDGVIVDERVVNDTADGTDPSGNDDLTESDSPALESSWVADATRYDTGRYVVEYATNDPAGKFTEADVWFVNTDSAWATERRTATTESGTLYYEAGGTGGDEFRIVLRVKDDDGIVVDESVVADTADGRVAASDPNAVDTLVSSFSSNPGQDRFSVDAEMQDADGDDDVRRLEYVVVDGGGSLVGRETVTGNGQAIQPGTVRIDAGVDVTSQSSYTVYVLGYDDDGNYDWDADTA